MATDVATHYNNRAKTYDDHTPFHTRLAQLFVEYAQPGPGLSILDLACGTGLVTLKLLEEVAPGRQLSEGQRVVGIDISSGMLEVARSKLGDGREGVTFVEHGIEDLKGVKALEGWEGKFDIITLCSALILLPASSLQSCIKHWVTYLAPGGRLVLDIPTNASMLGLLALGTIASEFNIAMLGDRSWIENRNSLRDLLEGAGLETVVKELCHEEWLDTIPARTKYVGRRAVGGEWDVDEGGDVFEEIVKGTGFEKLPGWEKDKARKRFEDVWKGYAGDRGDGEDWEEGAVKEVGGLWVGIGVKR